MTYTEHDHRLISAIAWRVAKKLSGRFPACELIGPGWEGWRQATGRVNRSREGWKGYVSQRIEGAMLDYIRAQSGVRWDHDSYRAQGLRRTHQLGKVEAKYIPAVPQPDRRDLRDLLGKLKDRRERAIAEAYWLHDLGQKDCGVLFGFTESNACILLAKVERKLKVLLRKERSL